MATPSTTLCTTTAIQRLPSLALPPSPALMMAPTVALVTRAPAETAAKS
jgi:hypothetical protein